MSTMFIPSLRRARRGPVEVRRACCGSRSCYSCSTVSWLKALIEQPNTPPTGFWNCIEAESCDLAGAREGPLGALGNTRPGRAGLSGRKEGHASNTRFEAGQKIRSLVMSRRIPSPGQGIMSRTLGGVQGIRTSSSLQVAEHASA